MYVHDHATQRVGWPAGDLVRHSLANQMEGKGLEIISRNLLNEYQLFNDILLDDIIFHVFSNCEGAYHYNVDVVDIFINVHYQCMYKLK